MPEVYMQIEWPNGKKDTVYSPSTIIYDYFKEGEKISIQDFDTKITNALLAASGRVLAKYGYECTSALGELSRLKYQISNLENKEELIKILSL